MGVKVQHFIRSLHRSLLSEQTEINDVKTSGDREECFFGGIVLFFRTGGTLAGVHGEIKRQDEINTLFLQSVQCHEDAQVVNRRLVKLLHALATT